MLLEVGSKNNSAHERSDSEDGWQLVDNRKAKSKVNRSNSTIFVAKIPLNSKAKEIWDWIDNKEGILDIILPRKRDRFNNRIGFIKMTYEEIALRTIERIKNKPLKNVFPDLRIAKDRNSNSLKQRLSRNKINTKSDKQTGEVFETSKNVNTNSGVSRNKVDRTLHKKEREPTKVVKNSAKTPNYDNHGIENQLELIPLNKGCFENCLIGFTHYPIQGVILKEVLDCNNLGIKEIKELSCWKYLLVFSSKEKFDMFNWSLVKDWLTRIRAPDSEDTLIKRKAVIEIRCIPLNCLEEGNLQIITKDVGRGDGG